MPKLAATLDANNNSITNVSDPVNPQDVGNKRYIDNAITGLQWKQSVRLATTAALPANTRSGNALTATGNGALSVDGQGVVTADRILVQNEATAANNGIYVVTQAGDGSHPYILTRSTDADNSSNTSEVLSGMAVFVDDGTSPPSGNKGKAFALQTTGAITLNTTSLSFAQIGGLGLYVQGTGIAITGATVAIDTSVTARKVIATIGDGSSTTITVTHNLNNRWVTCQIFDASTGAQIMADVTVTTANALTIAFSVAPANSAYQAVIVG